MKVIGRVMLAIFLFLNLLSACVPHNVIPVFRESLPHEEQQIVYTEDHDKTKDQAFVAAQSWIAKNFNSAKDVIQMSDKDAGIIIVKAVWPFTWIANAGMGMRIPYTYYVDYSLTVKVKENKAKFEFITGRTSMGASHESGNYLPEEQMPALLSSYLATKEGIIKTIRSKPDDF
jgi:hypothetical protein